MQDNADDELIDYNDLEEEKVNGLGQHPSRSPVQTRPSLKSDEDSDEVDSDLEKGQDTNMDSTSTQQALVEHRQKEFDILTSKLVENGWKLRLKVYEDPLQSNLACWVRVYAPFRTRTCSSRHLVPKRRDDGQQFPKCESLGLQ